MPFFGVLLAILGVWILINTFNGNLIDVVEGKARFFWQAAPGSSSSSPNSNQNSTPPTTSPDPGLPQSGGVGAGLFG